MGKLLIGFLLGFFFSAFLFFFLVFGNNNLTGFAVYNTHPPVDRVLEEDLKIFDDMVIIKIKNASISEYAPTGSMGPFLSEGANGIRIRPNSPKDIGIGDIISYRWGEELVVHRVIETGNDVQGPYYVTKGDNLMINDGRIRFEDIEFVTVGILW